ncbi:MAG: hypothetical protein LUG65_02470 [Clostridiales bacterium]|nr:hypothetical protein [Clostridiales bacterium]
MRTVGELELGFSDAQNYAERQNKEMFNNIFVRNTFLDDLIKPNCYFLIGEKGTGKTAYATYLSNNNYQDNSATVTYLSATDYEKFHTLKQQKNLDLTGYVGIWKVILLLLISKSITDNDKVVTAFTKSGIDNILAAIDDYYMNAFSPEIINVLKVIDESEIVAKLIFQHSEFGGTSGKKVEFSETRFQHNLYYIEQKFSNALKKIKLRKNVTLLIDGIDVRPTGIPYSDYIQCIRGLANAAWSLNTSLFQDLRDSKGLLKIVLLLRPDIYASLNLQNASAKLFDNSVFLDWRTTYTDYKTSPLYRVALNLLSYNQDVKVSGDIWEKYFDWKISTTSRDRRFDTAFMAFLKISLSRPRDILVILKLLQKKMCKDGLGTNKTFSHDCFDSDEFQNNYSEYFFSSLKDQLSFYYSSDEFEHFLKLFDYFESAKFSYSEYVANYEKFLAYVSDNTEIIPKFMGNPKELLQFLYDCNIITAVERKSNGQYFHFSYREKASYNIRPKVPIGEQITYRFHYGMYKKAQFGRY